MSKLALLGGRLRLSYGRLVDGAQSPECCCPPVDSCTDCPIESFTISIRYPAIPGTECDGFELKETVPKLGGPWPANGGDASLSLTLDGPILVNALIDIQSCDGPAIFYTTINLVGECNRVSLSDRAEVFMRCGRSVPFKFPNGATGAITVNRGTSNPLP